MPIGFKLPKTGTIANCCGSTVFSGKIRNKEDIKTKHLASNHPGIVVFSDPPTRTLKKTTQKDTDIVVYKRIKTRNGPIMFGFRVGN